MVATPDRSALVTGPMSVVWAKYYTNKQEAIPLRLSKISS